MFVFVVTQVRPMKTQQQYEFSLNRMMEALTGATTHTWSESHQWVERLCLETVERVGKRMMIGFSLQWNSNNTNTQALQFRLINKQTAKRKKKQQLQLLPKSQTTEINTKSQRNDWRYDWNGDGKWLSRCSVKAANLSQKNTLSAVFCVSTCISLI